MDKIQLLQERKAKLAEAGKEIRDRISALIDEESFVELSAFSFSKNDFYGDCHTQRLLKLPEICQQERQLAKEHLNMPYRPQTVSWRLMLRHAEYCERFAQMMIEKAKGNNFHAIELANVFKKEFGKHEIEIERYYDHGLAGRVTEHLTRKPKGMILD